MPQENFQHLISKSRFISGWQCEKKLYFDKFRPELKPEISSAQEQLFSQGTQTGIYAQQVFPGGVDCSPESHYDYGPAILQTRKLIKAKQHVIYEAAFFADEVLAALDILLNNDGVLHAIEVKSSTEVKEYHVWDAALQYWVMKKSGYQPGQFSIMFIDNQYVRKGAIEPDKLFILQDITAEVIWLQDEVDKKIEELKAMITAGIPVSKPIGPQCDKPFECEYKHHCWKQVPKQSVFNLHHMRSKRKWELYNQGMVTLDQIPQHYLTSDYQKRQVEATLNDEVHFDYAEIGNWMNNLTYPVYCLDFETIFPAIPPFDGLRPYQQIPFQYSIHKIEDPGKEPLHFEYLGDEQEDFRLDLVKNMIESLGTKGAILAYNVSFESRIIKSMIEWYPQYSDALNKILNRMDDLIIPFREGWYYHPAMNGSNSIKNVLPAMLPEFSYDELEIGNGGDASAVFQSMVEGNFTGDVEDTRQDLLDYCGMDTYAMVRILGVLGNWPVLIEENE
jgi:uncharacterized protein DUF2779